MAERVERKRAESLQDIMDNLRAMRVTLWPGEAFDLSDERELRAAAEWLAEEACAAGLIPTAREVQEERDALRRARTRKVERP